MRKLCAAAIPAFVLITLFPAPNAHADELSATRGQPLYEISHSVDVRIADGIATYVVRRTFVNAGTLHEEATLFIGLPHGAAVTGLRIRARDKWYAGELMEAEKAARLYEQLTGIGIHEPKDPALLHWVWADRVHLHIFPVLPGAASTVEYTLTVPTTYSDGRYMLSYPRAGATGDGASAGDLATPVLRVLPMYGDALTPVWVDDRRAAPEAPIVLAPPPPLPWVGEGAAHPYAGHVISHLEVSEPETVRKGTVEIDIDHTYKGDLEVAVVTPSGKRLVVHGRTGSGENDVRGEFPLELPKGTDASGTWHLTVSDHAGLDVGKLNAWSLTLDLEKGGTESFAATDTPLFIPDARGGGRSEGFAILRVGPPAIDTLDARFGRVKVSPKKTFVRLELDAAPELRPLPENAAVVFVVDASHSMDPEGIQLQLDIARAYLSHVPDARFEVVLYRRTATRLTGTLAPAADFTARIDAARTERRLDPGNGSAIEEGLRLAAEALAGHPGPKRIVAFTDDLLRKRFENSHALDALAGAPAKTILHIVLPDDDSYARKVDALRDDDHDLAPIATKHGGIFASLVGVPAETDKALVAGVLSLVRPVRIDHFGIRGVSESRLYRFPEALDEGTGFREMVLLEKKGPAKVVLTGMIWGSPFRRIVETNPAFDRATAGFIFSEDEHDVLTRAEKLKVAMFGRAVSPVTSYLAVEPGVRPSTVGLERFGGGGTGSGYGRGAGYMLGKATLRATPDLKSLMARGVDECVASYAPTGDWNVELAVETTYDEVVDVIVEKGHRLEVGACIREVAWSVHLDTGFWQQRETHTLSYP